jgi:hypothetical protein
MMILGIEWQYCAASLAIVIGALCVTIVMSCIILSGRLSEAERKAERARWEEWERKNETKH